MTSLYIELNKVKQLFIVHVSKSITKLSTIYNTLWNEIIFFSEWADLGSKLTYFERKIQLRSFSNCVVHYECIEHCMPILLQL